LAAWISRSRRDLLPCRTLPALPCQPASRSEAVLPRPLPCPGYPSWYACLPLSQAHAHPSCPVSACLACLSRAHTHPYHTHPHNSLALPTLTPRSSTSRLLPPPQELREAIVLPITHKEKFKALGIRPPKGVLLFGPPGERRGRPLCRPEPTGLPGACCVPPGAAPEGSLPPADAAPMAAWSAYNEY
jgi:hypothetical protein